MHRFAIILTTLMAATAGMLWWVSYLDVGRAMVGTFPALGVRWHGGVGRQWMIQRTTARRTFSLAMGQGSLYVGIESGRIGATLYPERRTALGPIKLNRINGPGYRFASLSAPHWLLVAALATPALGYALLARLRRHVRDRENRCLRCGYSRKGLAGRACPECGRPQEE